MKLHNSSVKIADICPAPSPRRVRMYLAEKDLQAPCEEVDLINAQNRSDTFRAKNPLGLLPVLELDDGTCIAETMAICRYFEALHPMPALFGRNPKEQAIIEMWNRRMEFEVL